MLQLLLHHTVYSLYLLLTFTLIKQVNNLYQVSSRLIKIIPASFRLRFLKIADITVFLLFFIQNLLPCCSDIEENPGPKYSSLTFCHWNLNGLTAHDSTKISLLQAYITQRNYDIICLTETFLNSSILSDDNRIKIDGYNLIRSDHPSDSKKGGVCICYKEHTPLILRDDINTLDNCLVTEIRSQNEKCFLSCIYHSPSQNQEEFKNFCTNFDILLTNINDELPLCSTVTGDFNARCSRWWKNDITNLQGQELDSAGYNQIIGKPTHVINTSMSCIDLIFCTNQSVISNHGVDVSIFDKCHHNIIYGKINICVPLPPTYVQEVWDYQKVNIENIKKAISNFDWNKAFENLSVDGKVDFLNKTLLNIFRNYIPNKKIKCDYRQPPGMTDNIKKSLKERCKLTKFFYKNGQRKTDHDKVLEKFEECTKQILEAKKNYILKMTKKLADSNTSPKTYWTILNRLLYNKKIPTIPPFLVDGKLVSDFCKKANIFNNFFASICTPIDNTSCLPSFSFRTGSRIKFFHVTENDISAIIKTLDPNKAQGCNNISIKMIKICSQSLTLPLKIIFEHSIKKGKFPEIWKKANVPVHKREDKMLVKNYLPISLLPIFGKMFERVIYYSLFNYFRSNRLFTPSQSGFLPGDSCIAQLLSIIHEIQTAFDENATVDVTGVFSDLSKAFDKVWHDGIIFKLKAYGVESELLSLLKNCLENREQRVVLNGQTSE